MRARNAVGNAVEKIDTKIRELERKIDDLQDEIRRCNGNINSLTTQKRSYIAQATAPRSEPEVIPQQENEKEESKTVTSKSSSKSSSKKKKK